MYINAERVFELMNEYGKTQKPFIFGIDFEVEQGFFLEPSLASNYGIYFDINGFKNNHPQIHSTEPVILDKKAIEYGIYKKAFEIVHHNLVQGNSYLTNLTFPTEIELNLSLSDIFNRSKARYRLLYKDEFVVFSPEIFVQIENGIIRSFPMKGTIDAALKDAATTILNDPKETSEHNTIVDLIRNDLSIIATDVEVDRFRYIEEIVTNDKHLLQVSSEISGKLLNNYNEELGTIFKKLLPAGSISGAPKKKTIQIIHEAENYPRGFYTGIFGYYNGHKLDSGVMIRFIKKEKEKLSFYSGGGITTNSNPHSEYNELIDKVYVPFI